MKVVGIVSEYNPFHNGHLYHLTQARTQAGADAVVCIMSGNFVQRGQAAVADKWVRARMALACGADLVLELPVCYALANAELFALGAVATLSGLGRADELWFGSENGSIDTLTQCAYLLSHEPPEVSAALHRLLDKGMAFPQARTKAFCEVAGLPEELLINPNNILAIEYIRAIDRLGSSLLPRTVRRHMVDHHAHQPVDHMASATAIRTMLAQGGNCAAYMPPAAYDIWQEAIQQGIAPVWGSNLEQAVLYGLRSSSAEQLERISDMAEGLEYRIKEAAMKCGSLEELVEAVKTKRYTTGRISRLIWLAVLGITKPEGSPFCPPQYIRVLGMNRTGMAVLAKAKTSATLPVITKLADFKLQTAPLLAYDLAATDLYVLGYPLKKARTGGKDFTTSPVVTS